jgi:AraC-like DNA-binding protein
MPAPRSPAPEDDTPAFLPAEAEARVLGPYVQTALETARELGVPAERLASALGWPADRLAPGFEDLPVRDYLALLEAAATLAGDPLFGLRVGEHARLSTYPIYGLVVCACTTLREAVAQTRRYEGLAHDLGRSRLEERDGVATYAWDSPWLAHSPPAQARHLCDSVMAGILVFASWLAQERLPVREIGFPYAPPAPEVQAAHRLLFGAPVVYGVPSAYGRFDAALLDRPVPNTDPTMFPVLQRRAEELMAARRRATTQPRVVADVRARIAQALASDRARLDDIADGLAMSPRTLQRKLAEAGTSWQAVHDAVRQELAEALLRDPAMNLAQVAYLLGYREQSSFNRACRDWFGVTPARKRAQLQAGERAR